MDISTWWRPTQRQEDYNTPTPDTDRFPENGIFTLNIQRVANGWLLTDPAMPGSSFDSFVAETPEKLAELVEKWARAQQIKPATEKPLDQA